MWLAQKRTLKNGYVYNIRKRKVVSNRIFSYESMLDIIKYLCIKSPMDWGSRKPKYVDVDLNKEYRGRVVINTKFKGYTITIRLLPNKAFTQDIHNLNMTSTTVDWLEKNFLSKETGLRLIVGATMSGKNTTALSLLKEVADKNKYKIISVEMPVEQELAGVEQINTEKIEEYEENIEDISLCLGYIEKEEFIPMGWTNLSQIRGSLNVTTDYSQDNININNSIEHNTSYEEER